ncbi:MAG: PTS sugar transporter subunit IIA [Fluviibacter sp.]|jgi:PTS system ascorbate-specific IIA component
MTETSTTHPVGILLLTHGRLGEALFDCARHVLGGNVPDHVAILSAGQDEPVEDVEARARELLTTLNQGGGVLVLTDLLGATPARVAARLIEPGKVEALSGVSLPMVLRAINYRNRLLEALVKKALLAGTECTVAMTAADAG